MLNTSIINILWIDVISIYQENITKNCENTNCDHWFYTNQLKYAFDIFDKCLNN